MLQNDLINSAKIADDAIVTAAISDGAVGTAQIADDAVGNTKLDLTANYTLTGSIRTPNGFDLLGTYDQTGSDVNYNSDVELHDFTSHLSTYKQFLVHTYVQNTSNGNMHVYFAYRCENTNAPTFQGQLNGAGSAGSNNTPFQGDNSYVGVAYRLDDNQFSCTKQLITNAKGITNNAVYYGIMYETQWVYAGTQTSHAQGSVRGTDQASPTCKVLLNVDGADSGAYTGNGNCRVFSLVWGVSRV
jgi:hypothetical protein